MCPVRLVVVGQGGNDASVDVDVREELAETLAFLRGKVARLSQQPGGVFYADVMRSWVVVLDRALRRLR